MVLCIQIHKIDGGWVKSNIYTTVTFDPMNTLPILLDANALLFSILFNFPQ